MAEVPRPLDPTWHRPHALLGYLCPSLRPEIVSGIALDGQQVAGLGAVGILGHLRGVDAGQADRQPLAAVLAPRVTPAPIESTVAAWPGSVSSRESTALGAVMAERRVWSSAETTQTPHKEWFLCRSTRRP